jgi:ferrous iron transport protein A
MLPETTLSQLKIGDTARVVGYQADTDYSARLMRLGLIPGTELEVKRRAPLGDPIQIQFRGYSLVLRPAEAHHLLLEAIERA